MIYECACMQKKTVPCTLEEENPEHDEMAHHPSSSLHSVTGDMLPSPMNKAN